MKTTLALLIATLAPTCCFAQTATLDEDAKEVVMATEANVQDLRTVDGFLGVCGRGPTQPSKKTVEAMKSVPGSEVIHAAKWAGDVMIAEEKLCFAYLTGILDTWEEGYEDGVMVAHFPSGIPNNEQKALLALPHQEFLDIGTAMKTDAICLPERIGLGEVKDTVVKHMRSRVDSGFLLGSVPTIRILVPAFRDAFPCPVTAPGKENP